MSNRLKEALNNKEFVVTVELVPGRGAREEAQEKALAEAERIYSSGRVHAISVTDNPGGNPALLADAVAEELHTGGIETLAHFSCKDRNRNQFLSQLYVLERRGIKNLLLMSGDYTYSGWEGRARPVFDLDPVQLLLMVSEMNAGLVVPGMKDSTQELPTHFFSGAVVNPFKWTEGEVLTQYFKLEKKILSGAQFIITQLGYDSRKMEELLLYIKERGYTTPVLANIYLTSAATARYMKGGNIPGTYISDDFLALLEEEARASDKGRQARFLRAAKMVAIARGLGFAGVHIGGIGLSAEGLSDILDTAEEIKDQWQQWACEIQYGQPGGFYLYEAAVDEAGQPTGLNTTEPSPHNEQRKGGEIFKNYGLSRFFHFWVLTKDRRCYRPLSRLMTWREEKKGLNRNHVLERLGKTMLYGCLDCGDCGLETTAYSCPMSQCPKCQRNGPCGGSTEGWCEVYPQERYCIYFKAYHRLKRHQELEKLDSFITLPNDWGLFETSGWGNYTHNRDNTNNRLYMPTRTERPGAAEKDKSSNQQPNSNGMDDKHAK